MKKVFALILLLCFTAQVFNQAAILVSFYLNRAYISKNLCENRYRPMLHCDGKCILAKKMKQQEKREQQNPEIKLQNKAEVISSRSFFTLTLTVPISLPPVYGFLPGVKTIDRPSSIFHPPGA